MNRAVIAGLGPVATATARLLQKRGWEVSFLARKSSRSTERRARLEGEGIPFLGLAERPEFASWTGTVKGPVRFLDQASQLQGDLLFLAVPHTAYEQVLTSIDHQPSEGLVLCSPGLGSGARVTELVGHQRVFSLSNFWGAAKYRSGEVVLKAIKRQVYGGSPCDGLGERMKSLLGDAGVNLSLLPSCLGAEFYNINLYVHPVFSLAPLSLRFALGLESVPKYLYKLFPEGPIERRRMRLYASYVQEVMELGQQLGRPPFNFLAYLHRDVYGVPSCFLEESEVGDFPTLSSERRGDLLFARYTGLLVDSSSQPDKNGRYFDFSAVPVERVSYQGEKIRLTRLLGEDLFHLTLLRRLSRSFHFSTPAFDQLWADFSGVLAELKPAQQKAFYEILSDLEQRASEIEGTMTGPVGAPS